MQRLELRATHKPVQDYYAALRQFDDLGVSHETAVRSAFQGLLDHCARQHDWTLVPEWEIRRPRQHRNQRRTGAMPQLGCQRRFCSFRPVLPRPGHV